MLSLIACHSVSIILIIVAHVHPRMPRVEVVLFDDARSSVIIRVVRFNVYRREQAHRLEYGQCGLHVAILDSLFHRLRGLLNNRQQPALGFRLDRPGVRGRRP
jgi:hypothetical protein